jgi:hypothetical protein
MNKHTRNTLIGLGVFALIALVYYFMSASPSSSSTSSDNGSDDGGDTPPPPPSTPTPPTPSPSSGECENHGDTVASTLQTGQTVYVGTGDCKFVYLDQAVGNHECQSGVEPAKWVGTGYTGTCLKRGQPVYVGCGFVYADGGSDQSAAHNECARYGTVTPMSWVGDLSA